MAEIFVAVSAAVKAGSAAVAGMFGGGAAATGATAATATTAASSTLTLSKVLSAGSALAAIGQGFAANAAAQTQAEFARTEAAQETAAGAAQARNLAKEYAELRGEQTVIQLANGLDIGVGAPVNIAEATQRQAERDLDTTRQNARNRSQMARLRARGLMSEGRSALIGGFGRAGQIGLEAIQRTG